MTATAMRPCLIVNADDYAYFRCVSRGILEAAARGIVTATGVLATAPDFPEHARQLREHEAIDVGVHLNLTDGSPLTTAMAKALERNGGRFPGKFAMARAILSGSIGTDAVRREWRAQIERCVAAGLDVRFVNSHEHLHMLPALFTLVISIAGEFGIEHVRYPTAEIAEGPFAGTMLRGAIITGLAAINRGRRRAPAAHFLGMAPSGKLDLAYLERCLPRLCPGQVYELMCHPGHFDADEVRDPHLVSYHDWEGELRVLTSPGAHELLRRHDIRLIGYRHVTVSGDRLVLRYDAA